METPRKTRLSAKTAITIKLNVVAGPSTPAMREAWRRAWARLAAKAREQAGNEANNGSKN